MLFNVLETDEYVHGFCTPNGFSAEARVRVSAGGRILYTGPCDQIIEDHVHYGRHATGRVGFVLTDAQIPKLMQLPDLTIQDAQTGFLIYRRNQPAHFVQKRVFHLETLLAPPASYAPALARYFAYSLGEAQFHGVETNTQAFSLTHYPSMYLEGRLHLCSHQAHLGDALFSAISVTDPFVALALLLDGLVRGDGMTLGQLEDREFAALMPVIALLEGVPVGAPEAMARRFKRAPNAALSALSSPLVGLLTGAAPGAGGARADVPQALEMMSRFDVVIDDMAPRLGQMEFAGHLGLELKDMPLRSVPERVKHLSEALRQVEALEIALESDLILYHCLRQASVVDGPLIS